MKKFVLIITVTILIGLLYYFQYNKTKKAPEIKPTINKVTFVCDNSKSITATFYTGTDKFVDLSLSDGRILTVPHAISASGARYANSNETFVFWNKGDTAFITEGKDGETTFTNCILKK
jgi:membrane-bound inhibitor of C-type lysozyme